MINEDFCIFILTHGRPDNVVTYDTLKKCGYTGKVFIVIDNEDKTSEKYYENYGDKVIMFDKKEISKTFDQADNFENMKSIVYARNACFEIAKKLKIKYFMQMDDDYTNFRFTEDEEGNYITNKYIKNLDSYIKILLDFYKSTKIHSIAMAQGGDFIGGETSKVFKEKITRKCMNSFLCSTERSFKFMGRINEDVNIYTKLGSIGYLFFTTSFLRLEQKQTQSNNGGMTDIYMDNGTYVKSFYSVIFQPSSVDIRIMGPSNGRLHHHIDWKKTVPMILNERHKK